MAKTREMDFGDAVDGLLHYADQASGPKERKRPRIVVRLQCRYGDGKSMKNRRSRSERSIFLSKKRRRQEFGGFGRDLRCRWDAS